MCGQHHFCTIELKLVFYVTQRKCIHFDFYISLNKVDLLVISFESRVIATESRVKSRVIGLKSRVTKTCDIDWMTFKQLLVFSNLSCSMPAVLYWNDLYMFINLLCWYSDIASEHMVHLFMLHDDVTLQYFLPAVSSWLIQPKTLNCCDALC